MATIIHPNTTAAAAAIISPSSLRHHHLSPSFPPTPFLHSPSKPQTPFPSLSTPKPHLHHHFSASTTKLQTLSPLIPSPEIIDCIDAGGFFHLLRLSVRFSDKHLTKALHAFSLKFDEDIYRGNALIVAYLKLGFLFDAYKVFIGLDCPNVVSYTALISSFAKSNRDDEAVELFFRMRSSGIEPNEYSFVAILSVCIRDMELELGLQIHGLVIKLGYLDSVFVSNALMGLYGKCGDLNAVLQVFDEMPHRDIASWNTVISNLVKEFLYERAFELFCNMQQNDSFMVDCFTLTTLLTACTGSSDIMKGREVHAHAIRIGFDYDLSVNNALIGFYIKCGSLKDVVALFERIRNRDVITWTEMITAYMEFGLVDPAMEIFDKMPERNCVSYNVVLAGLCRNCEGRRALDLFVKMIEDGVEVSEYTLTSVLNACGLLTECKVSEQIHGFVIKFGCRPNDCIEAALLDMCTRCGRMNEAEKMFRGWPSYQENSITLTSMICGYARNGQPEEAISLFNLHQSEGTMVVDEVASTSVLAVCGTLGFHEMGKQIHGHAIKSAFLADLGVGNAIISMYFKCWNMDDAIKVFQIMPARDIVSWNSLIAGHLLHRQGDEALTVWSSLHEAGVKPDPVSFVLILSAYRHTDSNLVESCRKLFLSMKTNYNIESTIEHYAVLVGVLGHWGLLEEAEEVISMMPFEPEASVWRALLDGCRIHLNTTLGKKVAKQILALEPQDPSTYILVSNLYSASGRWHCSEIVRKEMRGKGLRKHPAQSWIIHQNKVESFHARDKSHSQTKDLYSGLEILIMECLRAGYIPDTSFVLHEVEENQKKDFLFYHSAKLAATYGLLMTKPGKPVRIVKNILLCGDCHMFLKHVSVVTKRDIVLRDASGFHCFSDGQCSCKDKW